MTEREKKRQLDKAAKLKPKPILLPSGSWRCQIMINGVRISVVADTPEEAHAQAVAMKAGLLQKSKEPRKITVGEAMERYIESKDGVLSPASISTYRKIRRNYFQNIMPVQLSSLTQESVQRAVNAMAKTNAPKTVHSAHGFLSAVLGDYYPDLVLHTTLPQKRRYEASIPDMDEIKIILNETKGTEMELPILLAVWLGLRASEIRGLTWASVEDDFIHIKNAIVDTDSGPVVKGTKTYSGDRRIRLPEHIKILISQQQHTDEYIVHLSGQAMYKRFTRICQKAGLPHYRFHDLRHTSASVAMSIGVPNTYTQKRMGHKTDYMLKSVYLHTMKSKEDAYADMIDETFELILHTNLHTETENP